MFVWDAQQQGNSENFSIKWRGQKITEDHKKTLLWYFFFASMFIMCTCHHFGFIPIFYGFGVISIGNMIPFITLLMTQKNNEVCCKGCFEKTQHLICFEHCSKLESPSVKHLDQVFSQRWFIIFPLGWGTQWVCSLRFLLYLRWLKRLLLR